MSVLVVYMTCPSAEEAKAIAASVLEKRLAACANIFPSHSSLYEWEGEIRHDTETAMILKTAASQFAALKEEILTLHSYDVPCIAAWPAAQGHEAFLQWVEKASR